MLKNWKNNGTEEISSVTPTPYGRENSAKDIQLYTGL